MSAALGQNNRTWTINTGCGSDIRTHSKTQTQTQTHSQAKEWMDIRLSWQDMWGGGSDRERERDSLCRAAVW